MSTSHAIIRVSACRYAIAITTGGIGSSSTMKLLHFRFASELQARELLVMAVTRQQVTVDAMNATEIEDALIYLPDDLVRRYVATPKRAGRIDRLRARFPHKADA